MGKVKVKVLVCQTGSPTPTPPTAAVAVSNVLSVKETSPLLLTSTTVCVLVCEETQEIFF